jgi:cytochrome P450
MQSLDGVTLRDPRVIQNPYPYYERLRSEDPVHFDAGIRTWLITRYDDLIAVARNTEVFSDEMKVSGAMRSPHQAEADAWLKQTPG